MAWETVDVIIEAHAEAWREQSAVLARRARQAVEDILDPVRAERRRRAYAKVARLLKTYDEIHKLAVDIVRRKHGANT